jgi:hypothetical protein
MSDAVRALTQQMDQAGNAMVGFATTVNQIEAKREFDAAQLQVAGQIEAFKESLWKDPDHGVPGQDDGYIKKWNDFLNGNGRENQGLTGTSLAAVKNPLAREQLSNFIKDTAISQRGEVARIQFQGWAKDTVASADKNVTEMINSGALGSADEILAYAADQYGHLKASNLIDESQYSTAMNETAQLAIRKDLLNRVKTEYREKGLGAAEIALSNDSKAYSAGGLKFVASDKVKDQVTGDLARYDKGIRTALKDAIVAQAKPLYKDKGLETAMVEIGNKDRKYEFDGAKFSPSDEAIADARQELQLYDLEVKNRQYLDMEKAAENYEFLFNGRQRDPNGGANLPLPNKDAPVLTQELIASYADKEGIPLDGKSRQFWLSQIHMTQNGATYAPGTLESYQKDLVMNYLDDAVNQIRRYAGTTQAGQGTLRYTINGKDYEAPATLAGVEKIFGRNNPAIWSILTSAKDGVKDYYDRMNTLDKPLGAADDILDYYKKVKKITDPTTIQQIKDYSRSHPEMDPEEQKKGIDKTIVGDLYGKRLAQAFNPKQPAGLHDDYDAFRLAFAHGENKDAVIRNADGSFSIPWRRYDNLMGDIATEQKGFNAFLGTDTTIRFDDNGNYWFDPRVLPKDLPKMQGKEAKSAYYTVQGITDGKKENAVPFRSITYGENLYARQAYIQTGGADEYEWVDVLPKGTGSWMLLPAKAAEIINKREKAGNEAANKKITGQLAGEAGVAVGDDGRIYGPFGIPLWSPSQAALKPATKPVAPKTDGEKKDILRTGK